MPVGAAQAQRNRITLVHIVLNACGAHSHMLVYVVAQVTKDPLYGYGVDSREFGTAGRVVTRGVGQQQLPRGQHGQTGRKGRGLVMQRDQWNNVLAGQLELQ
eukprot:gene17623-biopygen5135